MYESFFRLNQRPFIAAPQVDRYFAARTIEAARQNLARCIERAEGAGLLVGPSGTGKSLLCQLLAEQFRDKYAVALLSNGHIASRRALLQAILFELGLPYRRMEEGDLRLSLIDHLAPSQDCPEGLLLIVDEAHALPARLLEELRMITNVVRDGLPRVRLVLAGSALLEERLSEPRLESFSQRIAVRAYLEAFDRNETIGYVKMQVQSVGGKVGSVFSDDALDAVHRATDGVPRLINQLCDHALVLAFAGDVKPVDAAAIEEAWADLQQLPTPWNESAGAPHGAVIEFGELDDDDLDAVEPETVVAALASPPPPHQALAWPEPVPAGDALEQMQAHLEALEEEFQPVGTIRPAAEINPDFEPFDPFGEPFAEEEVVLDPYATFDDRGWTHRQQVYCAEGRAISALMEQLPALRPRLAVAPADELHESESSTIEPVAPAAQTAGWAEPQPAAPLDRAVSNEHAAAESDAHIDAEEIIVVEDDPHVEHPLRAHQAPVVRRQEFRQLFARLRRG